MKIDLAISAIENLGFKITYRDNVKINFWFRGSAVHFYFKTEWATGKGIKDGRGLPHLLDQIKNVA